MTHHITETIIDSNTGIVSTVTADFTAQNLYARIRSLFLQILKTSDLFDDSDFLKQDILSVRLCNQLAKVSGFETSSEFNSMANCYNRNDVAHLLTRACLRELYMIFSDTDKMCKLSDIKFAVDSTTDTRTENEKLNYFFGYLND